MPIIKLNAHLSAILKSAPYITDAPKDGLIYGRQNGEWVEVQDNIKTADSETVRLDFNEDAELSAHVLKTPGSLVIEQSDSAEQTRFDGSEEVVFKLPLASVDKAGEVKKAIAIKDSNATTLEELVRDYNKLLRILRDAGIIDTDDNYNYVTHDGEHLVTYDSNASKLVIY